jgi:hypothetical protein
MRRRLALSGGAGHSAQSDQRKYFHGGNPPSHRDVVIDRRSAAQLIDLASYLLAVTDAALARVRK